MPERTVGGESGEKGRLCQIDSESSELEKSSASAEQERSLKDQNLYQKKASKVRAASTRDKTQKKLLWGGGTLLAFAAKIRGNYVKKKKHCVRNPRWEIPERVGRYLSYPVKQETVGREEKPAMAKSHKRL